MNIDSITNNSSPSLLEIPNALRKIKKISLFLSAIEKQAKKICLQKSNHFLQRLSLPTIKKILSSQNTNLSSFSKTDTYKDVLILIFLKAHIERQLIKTILETGKNNLGLTETEKLIFSATCDLGDAYDNFFLEWQQVIEKEKITKSPQIQFPYMYVTFSEKTDGELVPNPYIKMFSKPLIVITKRTEKLVKDLSNLTSGDTKEKTDRKTFIEYFTLLNDALLETNLETQETLFSHVDQKWLAIKGRFQPIHMMETYADPLRVRVTPDFSLAFLDENYSHTNIEIKKTKERIITFLKKKYHNKEILKSFYSSMTLSTAGVYTIFASGKSRISKFVGKNVPNRTNVRLTKGVKIFINMESIRATNKAVKRSTIKILGKKTVDTLFSDENEFAKIKVEILTGGHEIAHNAFVHADTRDKLGAYLSLLDEQKADLTTILAAQSFLSKNETKILLRLILSWNVARLKKKDIIASQPYYFLALISLQTMIEAKIIEQNAKKFSYDESPKKIADFFVKLKTKYDSLITVYESMNPEKAQTFIDTYNNENTMPLILAMQNKLQKN